MAIVNHSNKSCLGELGKCLRGNSQFEPDHVTGTLVKLLQLFGNRIVGITADGVSAGQTLNRSNLGEQESQVISGLGRGSNRGTAAAAGILACHGNRCGNPFNSICSRFFKPIKKLPGIDRETLDIATLAFCIERVECQARLSTPANPTNGRGISSR